MRSVGGGNGSLLPSERRMDEGRARQALAPQRSGQTHGLHAQARRRLHALPIAVENREPERGLDLLACASGGARLTNCSSSGQVSIGGVVQNGWGRSWRPIARVGLIILAVRAIFGEDCAMAADDLGRFDHQ